MTSPGSACVSVGDLGLRDLVLAALAGRGYHVRLVAGPALRDALRPEELVVVALGAGGVDPEDIVDLCDRRRAGWANPLIALIDRRERHLAAAALAAGATHVRFTPLDAEELDLELTLAERRATGAAEGERRAANTAEGARPVAPAAADGAADDRGDAAAGDAIPQYGRLPLADRLAALGTLAAGVAHEINNPLTYVLIGIEAVAKELRRKRADEPLGTRLPLMLERLHGAMEGGRRVRRIVTELRSLARLEEEEQCPVDVCAVLDGAASIAEGQLRHRPRLIREYRPDLPPVLGRRDRLGQVFLNLLLHAAQAGNGAIALRADLDGAGRVAVEVEDVGSLPEGELDRSFDPLFTSRPVAVGTGFGLWVCQTIVIGLGGELSAWRVGGAGTVLRVVLPAAPAPAGPSADESARRDERQEGPAAAPLQLGRVLIIDDDQQVAESMAILFEGNDVQVVHSGREGLRRLLAGEDYDWIFCDLMMRDLSGMDLYEQVRQARPAMEQRFVFMTGGAFTARARAFVEAVQCPWLTKPFDPHQVVAALKRRPSSR